MIQENRLRVFESFPHLVHFLMKRIDHCPPCNASKVTSPIVAYFSIIILHSRHLLVMHLSISLTPTHFIGVTNDIRKQSQLTTSSSLLFPNILLAAGWLVIIIIPNWLCPQEVIIEFRTNWNFRRRFHQNNQNNKTRKSFQLHRHINVEINWSLNNFLILELPIDGKINLYFCNNFLNFE